MDSFARIIFIINKLMEAPHTVRQLEEKMFDEFKLGSPVSDQQIYNYLKALRKFGFIISKSKKTKNSGELLKIEAMPFKLNLKEEEREFINDLFSSYPNQQTVMGSFFDTINNYLNFDLENIIQKEELVEYENKEIYPKAKKVLEKAKQQRKKVSFKYEPVSKEIKTMLCFPYRIEKDEKKTERVLAYNDYFKSYSEYNLARFRSIPEIMEHEVFNGEFPTLFARFKLYQPVVSSYHYLPGEIKESTDDEEGSVIVKVRYFTPFRLVQKLLKYGEHAEIIEPKDAREEMKKRILNMSNLYKNF
jgi:predicted DNA-binding transcriptional regulator YafY